MSRGKTKCMSNESIEKFCHREFTLLKQGVPLEKDFDINWIILHANSCGFFPDHKSNPKGKPSVFHIIRQPTRLLSPKSIQNNFNVVMNYFTCFVLLLHTFHFNN